MQKVAWPSTMVQNEKSSSMMLNAERSAMPVMMPGSAIGTTNSSEIASRPKNRARASAAAAPAPSSRGSRPAPAAAAATLSDNVSAAQMSGRVAAMANHRAVSPGGGKT